MGPTQTTERLLGIATMLTGIFTFTFATGALTSMISNEDSRKGQYREKLDTIKKLKHEYKLDDSLFEQLQAFIIFHTICYLGYSSLRTPVALEKGGETSVCRIMYEFLIFTEKLAFSMHETDHSPRST